MRESDLATLVSGTADVAFGVGLDGRIRCWNSAAAEYFGIPPLAAIGSHCGNLLCPGDEQKHPECPILQHVRNGQPVPAFDALVQTARGSRWVNLSVILVPLQRDRCALHLARDVEQQKRMEQLARSVLTQVSALTSLDVEQLMAAGTPSHASLTAQETRILRMLVEGRSTNEISGTLCVSAATVRNHIEHILQKLSSHSRIQAVLRAVREKLV